MNYINQIKMNEDYWVVLPLVEISSAFTELMSNAELNVSLYRGDCLNSIDDCSTVVFKSELPISVIEQMMTTSELKSKCSIHKKQEKKHNISKIVLATEHPNRLDLTLNGKDVAAFLIDNMCVIEEGIPSKKEKKTEALKKSVKTEPAAEEWGSDSEMDDFLASVNGELKKPITKRKAPTINENKKHKQSVNYVKAVKTKSAMLDDVKRPYDLPMGCQPFARPEVVEPLKIDFPTDFNKKRDMLRKYIPRCFTDFKTQGLEGVYKDMRRTLPLFATMLGKKRASGKKHYFTFGVKNTFLREFICYGSVNTEEKVGLNRCQIASAMFNNNMKERPAVVRDMIIKDMLKDQPDLYKGLDQKDTEAVVGEYLQSRFGHLKNDVPFEAKLWKSTFDLSLMRK